MGTFRPQSVLPGWGFFPRSPRLYLHGMSKPLELPPAVAGRFVEDMCAFFAEKNTIKADEIAARRLHALRGYLGPRYAKFRLTDVKEMFLQMRDQG